MNNLYHLTQKVLTAAGGSPRYGDYRTDLLKKLLVIKGGTPDRNDNEPSLWRKIATAVGASVDHLDGTWECLFKLAQGANHDDSEWQLMNKLWRRGFNTFSAPLVPPAAPTNLDGIDITDVQFTLTFDEVVGATSYKLDVGDGFDFSVFVPGFENLTIAGSPFNVTGLTTASIYAVRLRAVSPEGTSEDSETILVSTA